MKNIVLDEYDNRAVRALTCDGEHTEYFTELLEQEQYRGDTSITPIYLRDIGPSCTIVMSEYVFKMLRLIKNISYRKNVEVPFFMFGEKYENGCIYFYCVEYHAENLEQYYASFKPLSYKIDRAMNDYLARNNAEDCLQYSMKEFRRAVRCYGHTHPPKGGGDRFSFADLACVVEHSLLNVFFSSCEMESIDVLLTPSGDVNFIKYESNELMECFLKYQRIFVKMENGRVGRLSAYKHGRYDPYPIKRRFVV